MGYDLTGSYDLHIHTGPDVIPRKLDDLEMARQAADAGMRGFAVKSHVFPTPGRAAILRALYPELDAVGGIALNREVGGIHADAVEAAAKMGARMLWFPTMDAKAYRKERNDPNWAAGLTALDEGGNVSEEALQVLEVAKRYDLVVGTGHLGGEEAIRLVEAGHKLGLKRMCLTHVTLPVCQMSVEQLNRCVAWGAMSEYSYCHLLSGKCSIEYVVEQIRAIGAEHVYLSTDLGQKNNPYPVEGLLTFCTLLQEHGITDSELDRMLKINPHTLLY
jgi:hypothetical protein